jgi:hypothetical protein
MTSKRLSPDNVILGVMNEIPEQLGLKGNHGSKIGKMMLKNTAGDPKLWYF